MFIHGELLFQCVLVRRNVRHFITLHSYTYIQNQLYEKKINRDLSNHEVTYHATVSMSPQAFIKKQKNNSVGEHRVEKTNIKIH